ncbi:hypothetical protein HOLleu_41125 [Holothuria leucospilota]|uniref:CCHC-type domain-containing protein n=1 Tax=Holothuria leucospilota TaxID=206669 RepID=A0A9Q0YIR9_HOLLE|nr:hypothetical protein HOLleu_41125 [Holothuria leucospilota]
MKDASEAVHPIPGHTWFRRNSSQSSRIDRVYIAQAFTAVKAETADIPFSDHIPVYINIKFPSNAVKKKSYWKYNVSLNLDERFCRDFLYHYDKWSSLKPAFGTIVDWWENIKIRIKELSIRHGIRIARDKRNKSIARQAQFSNLSPDDMDNQLRSEVEGAFIRSRIKYLEDGEKPSAFFFRQESRRASKKIIQSVRNDSDDIVTNDNDNSYVFHNFYSNIFSREHHVNHNLQTGFIKCLKQTVDPIDKENLDRPIALEEVNAALVSASNNKSPGIDGIPYEFYRKFFNVIGNDMANIHEVNREASIQICVDSDVKSFGIFEFLTDRGVNVSQDLVAVQELTGKMWDITFKTVEAKRRVWPRICDADGCRVTSYNGSTTIVNVLFVPHELNDNVVRYILGRYGKVLCGRFKTYPNHPGVFNGIRQYQMELSKDIPSSLRIGGRNCWIRYGGQPRTCLKCGGDGHDARDCNQIICFKCQAPGHKSSECKAEASCTVCLKSGHIDLNCPLSFANIIKPTAAKWIAGAAEVVAQEVPPGDAKLLAEKHY